MYSSVGVLPLPRLSSLNCDDLGTLLFRLRAQDGTLLPQWQVMEWTIQVAMGLQHLHKHHVLHRDLKTQNIFLTRNRRNNKQHIKLGPSPIRSLSHRGPTPCALPYVFHPPDDGHADVTFLP